jgi:hypothetical protein
MAISRREIILALRGDKEIAVFRKKLHLHGADAESVEVSYCDNQHPDERDRFTPKSRHSANIGLRGYL